MDLDGFESAGGDFGGYGGHDGYGDYRLPENHAAPAKGRAARKPLLPKGVLLWETKNGPSLFSRKLWLESAEG